MLQEYLMSRGYIEKVEFLNLEKQAGAGIRIVNEA
jgi:hypothetical protein